MLKTSFQKQIAYNSYDISYNRFYTCSYSYYTDSSFNYYTYPRNNTLMLSSRSFHFLKNRPINGQLYPPFNKNSVTPPVPYMDNYQYNAINIILIAVLILASIDIIFIRSQKHVLYSSSPNN